MVKLNKESDFIRETKIGGKNPVFLIAGPCVIESFELLTETASFLKKTAKEKNIFLIFKSSYDKANRSSIQSFRGFGIDEGLRMLADIKKEFDLPILTDVHLPEHVEKAAKVADILQIPAFLSRQTDLILEAAKTNLWVNIKKGQFMAPSDALKVVEKFHKTGSEKISICERGYTFGYNNLVVDMRGIDFLRSQNVHVVMDITHSTQLPGGGEVSGGEREMAQPLARAAAAVGVDGFFLEAHPNPPDAKSDATNQMYLKDVPETIDYIKAIDMLVKNYNSTDNL
ncbi:MAG: 3-deoxy-8-phosphooctulonate synthase [Spirochaetia bacterium]|nr:3-deoxy-8-phosphooctulonate synthase [Spirochaetia bacterium]